MNGQPSMFRAPDNPFATRYTRPGAIGFLFPPEESGPRCISQLAAHHWWGEIVGPHGVGKSTLLATLMPLLVEAGRAPLLVELHAGERRFALPSHLAPHTQVIVDGYEQLGRLARHRLVRRCRQAGCGLLVTAHTATGLPTVIALRPDLALAHQVVRRLTEEAGDSIDPQDVETSFAAHHGCVREMLFDLYDLYERRKLGD